MSNLEQALEGLAAIGHLSPEAQNRLHAQPVWVQGMIAVLARKIMELNDKLAAGPENSNVFVSGRHTQPDTPLGKNVHIEFRANDGRAYEVYFDNNEGQALKIYTSGHAHGYGHFLAAFQTGGINTLLVKAVEDPAKL